MLALTDDRWLELRGGYRTLYDPRSALIRLRRGDVTAFEELWDELHHQNDVDSASYAVVPHLVDIHRTRAQPQWQTYALAGTIELRRGKDRNPPLSDWMAKPYKEAWDRIGEMGCEELAKTMDETTVRAILAAIAIAKQMHTVGETLLAFSSDELQEMILQYRRI